ncbi:MAG: serine hydrolase [Patescibacteria group bacterium]
MFRMLFQTLLTLSLVQVVPVDGGAIERAADLPTASVRSAVASAAVLANTEAHLPTSENRGPTRVDATSAGVVTSAQSVLVVDRESRLPLYAKEPDAVRPIGSISKLMTALVFLNTNPNLNTVVPILPEDMREGGRIYLGLNDPVSLRDLLHASLVGSDNTATMSLVRLSGLTETDFVARMNEKAKELGMKASTFHDPTGLSADNVSTARDIVHLLEAVQSESEIASTIILPEVTILQESGREVTIPTTDDLLTSFINEPPYQMLGGKTGYLPEAGYCIGVGVHHENAGDIFIVLLGSDTKATRVQEVKGLAAWTYRVFTW